MVADVALLGLVGEPLGGAAIVADGVLATGPTGCLQLPLAAARARVRVKRRGGRALYSESLAARVAAAVGDLVFLCCLRNLEMCLLFTARAAFT